MRNDGQWKKTDLVIELVFADGRVGSSMNPCPPMLGSTYSTCADAIAVPKKRIVTAVFNRALAGVGKNFIVRIKPTVNFHFPRICWG
jgi:hypothetical protein